jgi:hypothetical protein
MLPRDRVHPSNEFLVCRSVSRAAFEPPVCSIFEECVMGIHQSAFGQGSDFLKVIDASFNEHPIVGGETSVTLTSAPVLASLGVTVSALGTAKLDTDNATPVADFKITGGTEDRYGDVILHQGSGLALTDAVGTIDVSDFRIDTQNHLVFADVAVNGASAGNLAVFSLAANGTLTFTADAASAVDSALGTQAITTSVVVGVAHANPIDLPFSEALPAVQHNPPSFPSPLPGSTEAIVGGDTAVTLTSASTLASLGVSVKSLGFASLDTHGATPVANFPITGGTEGPGSSAVILHQGSGLELKDTAGTVDLRNLVIDTQNHVVDANVSIDGKVVGELAVFDLGANGALTPTSVAATALNTTLNTTAITTNTVIGTAVAEPIPAFGSHDPHCWAVAGSWGHLDHGLL